MAKIAVVGELSAKPEHFQAYLAKMIEHARASRKEAGCVRFDIVVSKDKAHSVFIYEIWKDQASLDVHANSPRMKAHREATKAMAAGRNVTFGSLHDSPDA